MSPVLSIISIVSISKVVISKAITSIVVVSIKCHYAVSHFYCCTESRYAECHYAE